MGAGETMVARQASVGDMETRVFYRGSGVVLWLAAPALPVLQLLGVVEGDALWWQTALYMVGWPVLMAGLGYLMWSSASEEKADTERLRRAGRPASAEVLAIELLEFVDERRFLASMTLRIAGDDVPAFETVYRADNDPQYRVGARFKAVVDPADNLYTLAVL